MDNLSVSLSSYLKIAKESLANGDNKKAHLCFIKAGECALLLAKQSSGVTQKKHLEHYKTIKSLIDGVSKKLTESQGKVEDESVNFSCVNKETLQMPIQQANSAQQAQTTGINGTGANTEIKSSNDNNQRESSQPYKKRNDSLSPQRLSDYIGQPGAVTAVKDLIKAALLKNSALPHIILYGSHGLGKTTFSKIIANEMHVDFTEINVSKITINEMVAILKKIKPKDIIFIDEIHTLPLPVAESVLYSAMQDGRFTYIEGKGQFAKTKEVILPPFTLIGATTEIGKLAKPFTQRAIQIRLEEYTDEVLSGILSSSFYKLGMKISSENSLYIAKRCRNNPRIGNSMVKRISDKALVRYAMLNNLTEYGAFDSVDAVRKMNIEINLAVIDEFFEENGIDAYGLENGDRELLKMIINRYGGGPVGIDTLARAMNESNNVIAQKYEAYLIKKGLIKIDRDGRVALAGAYRVLGLPVPEKLLEEERQNVNKIDTEDDKPKSKYDKRKVIACKVQDQTKCDKIEELIVYPENAKFFDEDLAELFPDVEKPYEAETKHLCELEIAFEEFNRLLICDSFLESRFATCMASVGFLKDIKAQTLEIPYISQMLANRRYFPDFVIKDYKGRIAVIEMKNYEMMSYHLNIDKYEQLKRFCIDNGYGYAEIMKEYNAEGYVSVEQLKNSPVNAQLESFIVETIEKNGQETGQPYFTNKDFDEYKKCYGETSRNQVYTILLNNRRLKNTDRTGNDFLITTN